MAPSSMAAQQTEGPVNLRNKWMMGVCLAFLRSVPGKYPRVWVVLMSNGPPGHPDASTLMLTQILRESFQQEEQAQFPQVEVRLYGKP
jgi:hypothetical protein